MAMEMKRMTRVVIDLMLLLLLLMMMMMMRQEHPVMVVGHDDATQYVGT